MSEITSGERGQLYWIGPYSILISAEKNNVPWIDGVNTMNSHGKISDRIAFDVDGSIIDRRMTRDFYRSKYARKGDNGLWFYRDEAKC